MRIRNLINKKEIFLIILSLIFPILIVVYSLDFMVWFVNVPLLLLVYKKSLKKAALLSAIVGISTMLISNTWILRYNLSTYLISSFIFALFILLFGTSFNILSKRINKYLVIFVAPFIWSILQIIFYFSPISSYWADYSMFHILISPLIWYVGSNGITFLIILMNSIIAFSLIKKDKGFIITGILLFVLIISMFIYSYNAQVKGNELKIALVQGNFDQSFSWRKQNSDGIIFSTYKDLSLSLKNKDIDLIIWPEYAIPNDLTRNEELSKKISNLAKEINSTMIVGSLIYKDENLKEKYDTAFVYDNSGEILGHYNSIDPLPFDRDTIAGDDDIMFSIKDEKFGILSCYEETNPRIAKNYVKGGASFLVSISNNMGFVDTFGINFPSRLSRLKAAENNKYLVRATNNGITQVINSFGKTLIELKPETRDILIYDIYTNNNITFYAKYGNIILYLILLILSIIILIQLYNY